MAKDIVVKITDNELFESVVPIDRVITIDDNGIVYLADTSFEIPENLIDKEL